MSTLFVPEVDELEAYVAEAMEDPAFRAAYDAVDLSEGGDS